MQILDFLIEIVLLFILLNVNCKQVNQRVIWVNWSDIQIKLSDIQVNQNVDFYYDQFE